VLSQLWDSNSGQPTNNQRGSKKASKGTFIVASSSQLNHIATRCLHLWNCNFTWKGKTQANCCSCHVHQCDCRCLAHRRVHHNSSADHIGFTVNANRLHGFVPLSDKDKPAVVPSEPGLLAIQRNNCLSLIWVICPIKGGAENLKKKNRIRQRSWRSWPRRFF